MELSTLLWFISGSIRCGILTDHMIHNSRVFRDGVEIDGRVAAEYIAWIDASTTRTFQRNKCSALIHSGRSRTGWDCTGRVAGRFIPKIVVIRQIAMQPCGNKSILPWRLSNTMNKSSIRCAGDVYGCHFPDTKKCSHENICHQPVNFRD